MIFDKLYNFRNRPAFISDGTYIPYSSIIDKGSLFSKYITNKGLCLVVAKNHQDVVISYLSFLEHKIPVLLLNNTLNHEHIINVIKSYKPAYMVLEKSMVLSGIYKDYISNVLMELDEFVFVATSCNIDYNINDNLSLLLTTSGTTGSQKFVRLSKDNIYANTESISTYLPINTDDTTITTLPLSYSYGLSIINTHLFSGASILLYDGSVIQKDFWLFLKEYNITSFGGVPYTYEMLERLRFSSMDLPNLRYITQAGGRLLQKQISYYKDMYINKQLPFFKMYGQTEATARISYLPYEDFAKKEESIGKPIPNGEMFIYDNNKNKLKANEEGELIYKGKNVFLGYASSCYDLYKDDENNNILHTGDLGYYDNDGYFYITGRKKRFLKIFGNRINLEEVENILNSHGFSCACAGHDDKMIIYIENSLVKNNILDTLKKVLDIHPSGYSINVVDKIPRNNSGKIDYHLLESL